MTRRRAIPPKSLRANVLLGGQEGRERDEIVGYGARSNKTLRMPVANEMLASFAGLIIDLHNYVCAYL